MDVRCEKCMTVYEFDDSQVGENGVTVKCTQCGNLFKVKRRSTTAEHALGAIAARSPAYVPPAASPPPAPHSGRNTARGVPVISQTPPKGQPAPRPAPPPASPPASPPAPPQARTMPAPQPPAVAPTPTPTVQARRVPTPAHGGPARSRQQQDDDLALTTTAPMTQPGSYDGPSAMGRALPVDDPYAPTAPRPRITPPALNSVPPLGSPSGSLGITLDDIEEISPVRASRAPLIAVIAGASVLVLVGAGFALRGKLFGGGGAAHVQEEYTQARQLFLLDTEDSFHQASQLLEQAHGAEEQNALVLAALGELQATWAGYLRDDARDMEAHGGSAVEPATRQMRKTAQQHLDDAKRYTADAQGLQPDALEVNRAMAEFLRVDGAPIAEASRYLDRALAKRPADAETMYAQGALFYREGRMDEARGKLEQANVMHLGATQKPLFRALYLMSKIDALAGRKDEARRELGQLTGLNPQHDRARALLASLEAPPPSPAPVAVVAPVAAPSPAAAVTKKEKPAPDGDEAAAGGDYNKLVAQADRLSENGRADQARKLYERALAQNPKGVEALTGLGYCDLDGERFLSALDHFKQALNVVPEYGEALIGLGESYKVRGDKVHAVEFYRRYLKSQPSGPKAAMAKKNLQDMEPHLPPAQSEDKPPKASAEDKKSDDKSDDKELPRPPTPQADDPPP